MMIPPATATAGAVDPGRAKAEATAREFESVFIGQMAKLMLESVETPGEFGGGHGEEMFRGVLAEQLGGAIQQKGGLGLTPAVLDQIIRLQEAAKK